jgi:hypothetical protein
VAGDRLTLVHSFRPRCDASDDSRRAFVEAINAGAGVAAHASMF